MAGHRLGRAIGDIVADTQVKVRTAMLRHEVEARNRQVNALMEHFERQLRDVAGPMGDAILANQAIPDEVRRIFQTLGTPSHSVDFIVQIIVMAASIPTIMSAAGTAYGQDVKNKVLWDDPQVPMEVGSAVQGVATDKIPYRDGANAARTQGIDENEFGKMVRVAQGPLPPAEIIQLIRKGKAGVQQLNESARQSGIHPQWIPGLHDLVFSNMDPATSTAARVEGHIDAAQHRESLAWHGVDPQWADVMYHTAGRPPGVQELLSLANRRLISQDTVTQAILESDIKDKYIEAIWESRVYLPPVRSVVAMMRSGALDPQRGRELLADQGVRPVDIEGYVKEATQGKTAHAKSLAIGAVLTMYQDFEVDRPTAERMLTNLHYDQESILLELAHAEHQREKTIRSAVVSRVRAQYDRRHINRTQASGALDTAGVPTQTRDMFLRNWDVEREVDAPQLTVAQITQGFKKGGITAEQMQARFEGLGYNPVDVQVLLHLAGAV